MTDSAAILSRREMREWTGSPQRERQIGFLRLNSIPFDENPPLNPSGIRLGSPAVTTRGFKEPEMAEVAKLIGRVLSQIGSEEVIREVRQRVGALTERFPLYAYKQQLAAV